MMQIDDEDELITKQEACAILGGAMYEHLHTKEVLPALHGYSSIIAGTHRLWRLEFNTLGAGRYLGLLADLAAQPLASHRASSTGKHVPVGIKGLDPPA